MLMGVSSHTPPWPWTETECDRRFHIILLLCLLISAIIGAIIPYLPRPQVKQQELQQVSPRLAKLILQKKQASKPPPIMPKKTNPEIVAQGKPAKKKMAQKKKSKKEKIADKTNQARQQAQSSGLLAMQDELADLRDSFNVAALQHYKPQQNKGKIRQQTTPAAILSAAAGKGSRGINTRNLNHRIEGQALAARRSRKVERALENSDNVPKLRGGHKAARSQEEIERVFQKNKDAIYRLYNRALRRDPTLQGRVLLELTIAPNGRITRIRILSSELGAPKLEKRLLSRIKLFRFSARDVDTVTVTYPIDFLPS